MGTAATAGLAPSANRHVKCLTEQLRVTETLRGAARILPAERWIPTARRKTEQLTGRRLHITNKMHRYRTELFVAGVGGGGTWHRVWISCHAITRQRSRL